MKVEYEKETDKTDRTGLIFAFMFITTLLCFILIPITNNLIFLGVAFIVGGMSFFIMLYETGGKELGFILLFPLVPVLIGIGLVIYLLSEYFPSEDALISRIAMPMVLTVAFLGMGICVTIHFIQMLVRYFNYETIEAIVIENIQHKVTLYQPTFEYNYNGTTYKYEESKYSNYYAGLQEGDTVKLKINPENPEDIIYMNFRTVFSHILAILLGILFTSRGISSVIHIIEENFIK